MGPADAVSGRGRGATVSGTGGLGCQNGDKLEREIVGRAFVNGGSGRGGGSLRSGLLISRLLVSGLLRLGRSGTLVATLLAVAAALLLSVLGVLAGLAPSLRAMQIKPVDAMREE